MWIYQCSADKAEQKASKAKSSDDYTTNSALALREIIVTDTQWYNVSKSIADAEWNPKDDREGKESLFRGWLNVAGKSCA